MNPEWPEHMPVRFSRINARLLRGGQPSEQAIVTLADRGVNTVINLRREGRANRRREARWVRSAGMIPIFFPFYGVFGASTGFLDRLLEALVHPAHGTVFVHCLGGRDRTSLAVALYRVVHEGWDPTEAWQTEALAYGHKVDRRYRMISRTYARFLDLPSDWSPREIQENMAGQRA
mgnify:CR=1 FL=1